MSTSSHVLRRFAWVTGLAFASSGVATGVTFLIDSSVWWHSAVSSGLVAFICTMAAIHLSIRIIADPSSAMKAWMVGMFIHFGAVVGVGLTLTLSFQFNPVAAILAGAAPAMICVFGNAWIVQALTTSSGSSESPVSSESEGLISAVVDGTNGHVAETLS